MADLNPEKESIVRSKWGKWWWESKLEAVDTVRHFYQRKGCWRGRQICSWSGLQRACLVYCSFKTLGLVSSAWMVQSAPQGKGSCFTLGSREGSMAEDGAEGWKCHQPIECSCHNATKPRGSNLTLTMNSWCTAIKSEGGCYGCPGAVLWCSQDLSLQNSVIVKYAESLLQ